MAKKPEIEDFRKIIQQTEGNLTKTAEMLGCSRQIIWKWAKDDSEFASAITESRKRWLDQCITSARLMCKGVPILDNGKFVGWEIPPDGQMLRYFISTLGRDEGFGESMTIRHTADEGIDVSRWIEREIELKKQQSKAAAGD